MKNLLFISMILLSISACNRAALDKSNHEKDSLQAVVHERDSSLNEFVTSFDEVERNLDSVAAKQLIISSHADKSHELKMDQKARINANIEAINNLMDKNHKMIASLNSKLKASGRKNAQLEKLVATLNGQLAQKDAELAALNDKLTSLNSQVAQLHSSVDILTAENEEKTKESAEKSRVIDEKTQALHTAYYVVGKKKELQDAKVIDREGGLLGIGRTSKLKDNFDNSKFTRIDNTQTLIIPVNGFNVKIITSHPSDSYDLVKDETDVKKIQNVFIKNPEKFWSTSKYLVIAKN